jgi:predicted amidohydrolase
MKVALVQTQPATGDVAKNIEATRHWLHQAQGAGAQIVLFSELSLTGYEPALAGNLALEPGDERLLPLQQCSNDHGLTVGVGAPVRSAAGIHIGLILFQPQAPRQVYAKQYLHPDEMPYFTPASFAVEWKDAPAGPALAICYELSVPEHAAAAAARGAGVYLASVAKSVRGLPAAEERLADIARRYQMTVGMVNCIGRADGMDCGGRTAAWSRAGTLLARLDDHSEGILLLDTEREEAVALGGRD